MVSWQQTHQFLKLVPSSPGGTLHQEFLYQLEHRGDMPHLIPACFLRGQEFCQQQNYRCQQALCRIIEVGVLTTVGSVPLRVDDGLGEDLRVLFCLCFGTNILGIFPMLIHIAVDQSQQVIAI